MPAATSSAPSAPRPATALEWTRLLLQLWELGGRRLAWLPDAASVAVPPRLRDRLGHGATAASSTRSTGTASRTSGTGSGGRRPRASAPPPSSTPIDGAAEYEDWYRRIWDFIADQLIDREHGGWRTEPIDPTGEIAPLFSGKPDLYHALQACLIPLLPTTGSITRGLATGGLTSI